MDLDKLGNRAKSLGSRLKATYDRLPEVTRNTIEDRIEEHLYFREDQIICSLQQRIPETQETTRFRESLARPLTLSDLDREILQRNGLIDPEMILMTGPITAADYLYDLSNLDPHVINGLDFSHANTDFRTFEDARTFVMENRERLLSNGNLIRDRGYSAEQLVASNLRDQGHLVEFPDDPCQTGFDLLVDGDPIQVKCGGASNIVEHFRKYPNIPVIANREVAEQFADNPLVTIDPSLSSEELLNVQAATENQIGEMGFESDIGVPVLLMVRTVYRAYRKYSVAELSTEEAIKYVALDSGAAIAGFMAGKKLGFAVGSLLAPSTGGIALVIGPLIGGVIGALLGSALARSVREKEIRAAYEKFKKDADGLRYALRTLSQRSLEGSRAIRNQLAATVREFRWKQREILLTAAKQDALTLLAGDPTYNCIVLGDVAQCYREDANLLWSSRKTLNQLFVSRDSVDDKDLDEFGGVLMQYRGAVESCLPGTSKVFDEVLTTSSACTEAKREYERLAKALR